MDVTQEKEFITRLAIFHSLHRAKTERKEGEGMFEKREREGDCVCVLWERERENGRGKIKVF